VLGADAAMLADCCLCTEAAKADFLSTYKEVIIGEIDVELIRCTQTPARRSIMFTYEMEVTMPTTFSAQNAARAITSPSLVAIFNQKLNVSGVSTTVAKISTSNMVVSEVNTSSSIETGWIVLLTLVCAICMLGVVGAIVWKVRTQRQRESSANVESTPEQEI